MPAEIDKDRAVYARTPAWHRIGTVLDDVFTAEDALHVLNPSNEPIKKVKVGVFVDGEWIESDDWSGIVERDPDDRAEHPVRLCFRCQNQQATKRSTMTGNCFCDQCVYELGIRDTVAEMVP